jgi:hypothetical protein
MPQAFSESTRRPHGGHNKIDLAGQRFGRLLVLEEGGRYKNGALLWKCRCRCPRSMIRIVSARNLQTGTTRSCGCLNREVGAARKRTHGQAGNRHGQRRTRAYSAWQGMWARCRNSNHPSSQYYLGRGITVCKRWQRFELFFADMKECPPRFTLERPVERPLVRQGRELNDVGDQRFWMDW